MPEAAANSYHSVDMVQEERASRKRFFVFNGERTNGAHQALVDKLKRRGHVEVSSVEDCHYCLAFCPIASRVGTDVGEALDRIPPYKPTVLVVMHHTFDQNHIVADSSRLVNQPNVQLTVDTLFYQDKLLDSNRNDIAWSEIQRCLGLPDPEVPFRQTYTNWLKEHWIHIMIVCMVVLFVALLIDLGDILIKGKKEQWIWIIISFMIVASVALLIALVGVLIKRKLKQ